MYYHMTLLCLFFKQHMGMTFLRYLGEVRISQAGRLITTTDMSVAEVMVECGFPTRPSSIDFLRKYIKKLPGKPKRLIPESHIKG